MPPPRWGEVREFCLKQGYIESCTDHLRYVRVLPDRTTSGTMISMGVDGQEIPPRMWHMVWKKQLRLASEDEFWKGQRGEVVSYAIPAPQEPAEPLPGYLQDFLRKVKHLSDADMADITLEQAQEMLNEHFARELREL